MTLEEQKSAYERELKALDSATSKMCRRMHFSTVFDILHESGLPYRLVQDWYDFAGTPFKHGYRYRFESSYDSPAMLYVQETDAGRIQHRSMHDAIAALRGLLESRLREIDHAASMTRKLRYAHAKP